MTLPSRILILSASAGAGHLRAAEAVEAACRTLYPEADARHVDVLTLAPPGFRRLYGKGYLDFVNRAPELLGILYDRTNRQPRHPAADALRRLVDRLNTRPFVKFLREFAPDVICHTHFLPAEEGAAISGENPLTVADRVSRLLASPDRLRSMARAARRLGHATAAMDVARELGTLVSS